MLTREKTFNHYCKSMLHSFQEFFMLLVMRRPHTYTKLTKEKLTIIHCSLVVLIIIIPKTLLALLHATTHCYILTWLKEPQNNAYL